MKKNSFLKGAFIATMGIVITKIIGILYVIPFYQIIGEKGGALYGYAYNIYNIFINISSAGIPLAISKLTSEYNALGLLKAKMEAFRIGKRIALFLSIISFIILFFFAPFISNIIMGNIIGGNTKEDITFVIRVISTAILIVPILSVYRGFFQGHKYIKPTSVSQVVEQIVRVMIILVGSYLAYKVFKLSLAESVGIAVFGATIGALVSYFYLLTKYRKNKNVFLKGSNEKIISGKEILKLILLYSLPLILIDVFKTLYNSVDTMMLIRILVNRMGYLVGDAESIISILSTWGNKLNMIITSIGTGIIVSLIPHLSEDYIKQDTKKINSDINKTFSVLLLCILPMTVGLSFLSKPVWILFYGYNELGFNTFAYYVYLALFISLFSTAITIIQLLKEYKMVILLLILGLLCKIGLNIPLIYLFNNLHLPAHYGSITASIIGYVVPLVASIIHIKRSFKIHFHDILNNLVHILVGVLLMVGVISLMSLFLPIYSLQRSMNILIIIGYIIVGGCVYLGYLYKMGIITKVFNK